GSVDEMHRLPLATFGRMDGGQDQVVVVEVGLTREVGAAIGGIERQLGEESAARSIAAGGDAQLLEIGESLCGVVVATRHDARAERQQTLDVEGGPAGG